MIRVVRARTLHALYDQVNRLSDEAEQCHQRYLKQCQVAGDLEDLRAQLAAAQAAAAELAQERDRSQAEARRHDAVADGRALGELEALRTQAFLDTEDRAVLRMLLRTARKQSRQADRVYVLFRHGELHSVHATSDAAEAAAEAEGAPRSGWTSQAPGAALPPAAEVVWRVQPLPLGRNGGSR